MSIQISIIIVTYNSSKYIARLLKSIEHSSKFANINTEIIIIDNNSIDKQSLHRGINEFKSTNNAISLITYYRKRNYGFGASCNYGAKKSTGTLLLFLNPDTELEKNTLIHLKEHKKKSQASVVGIKITSFDGTHIHRTIYNTPSYIDYILEFSNIGKILNIKSNFYIDQSNIKKDIRVNGVGGACLLIDRTAFYSVKGFDESYFMYLEDVDICQRLISHGYTITYCPHSKLLHAGGASSSNKYKIHHKAWYDSRIIYLFKYYPLILSIPTYIFFKIEEILLKQRERLINLINQI